MSRALNRLTARQVQTLKKDGWHADGGGLYLRIQGSGRHRSWVLVSTKGGKRKEVGIGSAGDLSLADARKRRDAPERVVRAAPIFRDFADEVIDGLASGWKNDDHPERWRNTLAKHAGAIMDMRVDVITTDDVLAVLRPIWMTIPDSAGRIRGRIERVLDAAKVLGFRPKDAINPAMWKGHLAVLLPRQPTLIRGHQAAMPYADVPGFIAALRKRRATAARALEFLILNANRTGEVLGADTAEVQGDLWVIPAGRMKMAREHIVTLTPRSLEIIADMTEGRKSGLIFPGPKDETLSNMAMQMLLRRMGFDKLTVHGFRLSFKDWALNCTEYADELSEEALAHNIGSAIRRAYRRSAAIDRRRKLMLDWEAFCLSAS